ncbi:MAG: hypothetical protein E6R04_06335 [Spirochaetes bacterium]|nr:MAG: hypothetical protein E6R04_06335 [Spirochaetota bacterium]
MASKTDICNRTLSKLGQPRVSNIDTDSTKAAKVVRYMYDMVRDSMLAAYPWNFAIKRAQLAAEADAPAWGYTKQYTLPVDFLSLLEIRGNPEYKVEGGRILTNEGAPLYILYISRITDAGLHDPLFNEAFSTRMAFEGCEEITQSNTKKQLLAEELKETLRIAYASDAIQEMPQELEPDTWLLARESNTDDIDYGI